MCVMSVYGRQVGNNNMHSVALGTEDGCLGAAATIFPSVVPAFLTSHANPGLITKF